MRRMWINQPSALQPHSKLHGTNVLMDDRSDRSSPTIYFLSGDTVSMMIDKNCLSAGWRPQAVETGGEVLGGLPAMVDHQPDGYNLRIEPIVTRYIGTLRGPGSGQLAQIEGKTKLEVEYQLREYLAQHRSPEGCY